MEMIGYLINLAIDIYIIIIILQVAVSWLIAFDVINAGNAQAQNLIALMKKATDPIYTPLRKFIPPIGGIDITPMVVIIGLHILQRILYPFFIRMSF